MAKYIDLCRAIDRTNRYMSNAIGMCRREVRAARGGERSRVDVFLRESETYQAFANGADLGSKFAQSRSVPGVLRWTHDLKTGQRHPDLPVDVDEEAGVVRQVDGGVFGVLSDVVDCLFVKVDGGKTVSWREWKRDPVVVRSYTENEVRNSSSSTSSASSMASGRRRIGQEWYREEVIRLWDGACVITRCRALEVLRASHIQRWADSTTAEQLDPYNGLLLAAHLDAAFEWGLISFGDDGQMLFSERFSAEDRGALGLSGNERLPRVYAENRRFLAAHRRRHGFD